MMHVDTGSGRAEASPVTDTLEIGSDLCDGCD